jgi:signal transduction histidine kinase
MDTTSVDLNGARNSPRAVPTSQRRAPATRDPGAIRPAVLIVDDVADNLVALEGMLRRDDVDILTALSGRAALDILLERDVAVALIDVQMPEMDGFELAALMRGVQKTRYVPIVFVTAGSMDAARVFKGYESGAVDYLIKPVDERILRSKVDVFVTLEEHRQQLRYADRMRELFIAILGHDLRNPLNGILMSAQLMLRRTGDEAIDDGIRRILRNGDRMVQMIDQLLDASRFRLAGGISLSPRPTDLRELTEQTLGEFDDSRQRFKVEVHGDTVGTWDADRLLQVVSNLCGNAVQHSPPSSPIHVRIHGRREDTVAFQVHSLGVPIPEELRSTLFDPFRGADEGKRRTQRLGLGLYITRQIAVAHGGTITFESSEESGTSFLVSLPRHTTVAPECRTDVPATTKERPDSGRSAAEKTILIVEDDSPSLIALGGLVRNLGYHVLEASSPAEALKLVEGHGGPVHLLLTDVRLPEMSGERLAARLCNSLPGLEVVFMSGLPEAPAAAAAFIQKPIDVDALVEVIERVLA